MRYLCLVYSDADNPVELSPEQEREIVQQTLIYDHELQKTGVHIAGAALEMTATVCTVKNRGGQTLVTDGPFVETRDLLTGIVLIEARDLNEAIQVAARSPLVQVGKIELRAVRDLTAELALGTIAATTG